LPNQAINSPISRNKTLKSNKFKNNVDWAKYEAWVNKSYRPKSAYDRIHYAKAYAYCLFENDCSDLLAVLSRKCLTLLHRNIGQEWRGIGQRHRSTQSMDHKKETTRMVRH
jgi:hypothetical protein